jgi:4-amino-4-deoxy-L-arabinose transferase-like glycosyltransferase
MTQERRPDLWRWLVLALCLLSFGKGVWGLGEQSLWWDESLSHYRASRPFAVILSNRMTFISGDREVPITPDNHPPLYFSLLRLVLLAAGESEFALRFLSLAAGVLLVPLLYRTGTWLYGPRCGAATALLGALSPLYLWAQQEARPYALLTLTALLATYATLRAVQPRGAGPHGAAEEKAPVTPEPASSIWIAIALAATAAMLVTHYHGFTLLPALGALLLLSRRRWQRRDLYLLGAGAILVLLLLLWALRVLPEQADIPGYVTLPLGTLLRDVFRATPLGITGTASPLLESAPFDWLGAVLLLAALLILGTAHRPPRWRPMVFLLCCFALPIAAIYLLSFVRPAYMNIRHLIVVSPFYLLLLGAALVQAERLWIRLAMALGVMALVAGMLLSTRAYVTGYAKEDHRNWGRYLGQHVRPDDLVLINPGASAQLYFYYVDKPTRWYGFPLLRAEPEATTRQIAELAADNDRLWIAQSMTPHWANPGDLALKWLRQNAMRLDGARFYSANTTVLAEVFRLTPALLDALPDDVTPVPLDFGERLSLLGTRSTADAVSAGDTLQLSFYWSALKPLDQAYRMTLALKDDRGYTWLQMDRAPYAGAYPTDRWPSDQIVRDDLDLDVPPGTPPGRYWLYLSVYGTEREEPALAARDRTSGSLQGLIVPVAQVRVTPGSEGKPAQREPAIPTRYRRPYRYGGEIALLGHSVEHETTYPGDVIDLDAYWQALRVPRSNRAFVVQLRGADGQVHASRTVAPSGDYAPTEWRQTQVVRGQYRLRIPVDTPAGDYTCHILPEEERPIRGLWPWSRPDAELCRVTVAESDETRSFEVPPMQHTLEFNLNDEVELLGYDLAAGQEAGPAEVPAGGTVGCTLYWRALQTMERNYTVFTHLVAADGRTWGQWDNQPQQGQSPTTRWVPGQVIADPYQIPVAADAPAGPVELQVGLYDRNTMIRLPVYGQDGQVVGDHVAVTELEVTRP